MVFYNNKTLMLMVYDSYRSFASLRMTTKRKRVILNEVKNLYTPTVHDILAIHSTLQIPHSSISTLHSPLSTLTISPSAAGNKNSNAVSVSSDRTVISESCWRMMRWQMDRPRPVPWPEVCALSAL